MSGDNFPNRYFPERYFPGGYFQGGEQNPGAMSASLAGSGSITGLLTEAAAVVVAKDTHDGVGYDPHLRKRRAKGGKREKQVEDLLAKLLGLVPEDPPVEIEKAVTAAKVSVERVSEPRLSSRDYIEELQAATLRLAKLAAVIRAYQDEEEDEELLLLTM